MDKNEIIIKLKDSIIEGLVEESAKNVKLAIDLGVEAKAILNEAVIKGAEEVGKRFENKEFFIADLLLAGDAIKESMDVLRPNLKAGDEAKLGTIMVGTPEGDIHNIGKSLMVSLLQSQGFDVIDLGEDIPPVKFVEEAKKVNPDVIGLSGLLTFTISKMRETVVELKRAKIRSKIILGGGMLSEETCKIVGADAWTKEAWDGVRIIKELVKKDGGN